MAAGEFGHDEHTSHISNNQFPSDKTSKQATDFMPTA
jgi:hypothetical protein